MRIKCSSGRDGVCGKRSICSHDERTSLSLPSLTPLGPFQKATDKQNRSKFVLERYSSHIIVFILSFATFSSSLLPLLLPTTHPSPPHRLPHDGAPGKTNRECTTTAGVPACSSIAATLFTSLYSDVSVGKPASPNCANVNSLRLLSLPTHSCPNR